MEMTPSKTAGVSNQNLFFNLLEVSSRIKENFEEMLSEQNLNCDGYRVLTALSNVMGTKGGISKLSDATGMQPSKIIGAIKKLIRTGYVQHYGSRITLKSEVQLNTRGIELMKTLNEYQIYPQLTFGNLNEIEKVTLFNLLYKVEAPWILKVVS